MTKTPLVELKRIEEIYGLNNRIFAKDESYSPSGSIKARTVLNMLEAYQEKGMLKKDSIIIEATSGNTGIALSYFSKELGYKAVIVMPDNVSVQRRELITKYGGEVVLVSGGMKECGDKVTEMLKDNKNAFEFGQFDNLNNPMAHFKVTAPEIDSQCPNADYIFAGIGTGGTVSGIGKFYKENKKSTKVIGVEPLQSNLLNGGKANPHLIQGIGANFIPKTYLQEYVDEVVDVDDAASIDMAKVIRKEENIDIGISSGAALLGTIEYIKRNNIKDKNIVVIFPDKGDRYTW